MHTRLVVEALEGRAVPASLSIGDTTVLKGFPGTQHAAVFVSLSSAKEKTFTVQLIDDGLSEYDEYSCVQFSGVSADVVIAGYGLGTIYGKDGPSYEM